MKRTHFITDMNQIDIYSKKLGLRRHFRPILFSFCCICMAWVSRVGSEEDPTLFRNNAEDLTVNTEREREVFLDILLGKFMRKIKV